MTERVMISFEDVSFAYGAEEGEQSPVVLNHVNLQVEEGSFVAILGRNGCGKSTMARLCNGILAPTQGRVLVDRIDTSREEDLLEVRRRVGLVFQNPDNQIVANVVEEDVAFALENLGVPSAEIRRRVDQALALVGMSEYALHAPNLLSGGQKQRVAIAGVIAMEPRCIVLDEPTAMLDPVGRREVMETVARLNREEGITILLITHHMDEAAQAGRVVVMHQGQVRMDGTPRQVFSRPEDLKLLGLDVPETVQLLAGLNDKGAQLPLDQLSTEECAQTIYHYLME